VALIDATESHLPEVSAPWVNQLVDPGKRHAAIESLGRNWLRLDCNAAAAWLVQTDHPRSG
jgi:hypothetical protein